MPKEYVIKKLLFFTAAVLLVLAFGTGFVFRNEIKTVNSIRQVDDHPLYAMEYAGDYGFDDFLTVGASSNEELIQFVTGKILKGLPINASPADMSCTTFNAVTPQGDHIFGRNFDMSYSPAMIVRTEPANDYASLSMVDLAFLGYQDGYLPAGFFERITALAAPYAPLDGINEKGLSVGMLLVPDKPTHQDTPRIDITSSTAVRMLLDKAATTDEAVAMLQHYDMHDTTDFCLHYQIADAAGNSVIVEYINNEMHVLKPTSTWQVCSNFYLTPGEYFNFGLGQDRYEIVMTGLKEKNGVVSEAAGMDLLKAAAMADFRNQPTGLIYSTQWSAIYNNTQKTVDLCMGRDYEQIYHFEVGD